MLSTIAVIAALVIGFAVGRFRAAQSTVDRILAEELSRPNTKADRG